MKDSFISSRKISYTGQTGIFRNIKADVVEIGLLINPQLDCLDKIIRSMFCINKCNVTGLTCKFQELICKTVEDCSVYYDCSGNICNGNCVGNCGNNNVRGLTNINNFNFSDNSNSFFHEEIINDKDLSDIDFSIMESDTNVESSKLTSYSKFIAKNLLENETLLNNNLKLISIDKISKGNWLFNGNISIEIPKSTALSNMKLFIYLDENVVQSGEIDLGSYSKTNSISIKSNSYNLMFENNIDGAELKIGIITFNNNNEIKLLKTTNFFANKM